MAINLNKHDLEFILAQIQLSEAHAAGTPLKDLIANPLLPYGVRTVDGSYNNLVEGREYWGAADQPMPRYLDPNYIDGGLEDPFSFGPGPLQPVTNTDYGVTDGTSTFPGPGTNGGHTGNVVDADPRIISNLVADMSPNNPAALYAALVFAESEDPYADLAELIASRVTQAEAVQMAAAAQMAFDEALPALDAAVAAYNANASNDPLVIAGLIDEI